MELNRHPPPPREFFRRLAARGEAEPFFLDVGGWTYRLGGLDSGLRSILEVLYEPFRIPPDRPLDLQVRVLDGGVDHFLPPGGLQSPHLHPLSLGWEGDLLKIRSYGFIAWVMLAGGEGEIALGRSDYEKPQWCVENFLRVCTAWKAVSDGGALLHGAGLLRSGKASIFIGAGGSGKSTLAAVSREGKVVSDDLTLVRRFPSGFRVVATMFRGTYRGGEVLKGDFPVGGIYRIFKAERDRLEPCPREHAVADLLAASPFVVDQIGRSSQILTNLGALDSAHPLAYLHFNREGGFWSVLPEA